MFSFESSETPETAHTENFPLRYVEERLVNGARFTLPNRTIQRARLMGAMMVAGGLLFGSMLAAWMAVPMIAGWQLVQQGEWFGWLCCGFGALALGGVKKCLSVLLMGIAVMTNRTSSEIELRDDRMFLHECFFGRRWTRKVKTPLSEFRQLRVGPARLDQETPDASVATWFGEFDDAIFASSGTSKPTVIAPCYPRSLLIQLADALVEHLDNVSDVETQIPTTEPITVSMVDGCTPLIFQRVVVRPETSNIEVEQRDDGTTYRVPAAGLRKGSKGLFGLTLFWNVFVLVAIVIIAGAALNEPDAPLLFIGLGMIPFVAVGIGTAAAVVNMGWRRTAIVTAGQQVFVISEGPFGKKTRTWHADELKYVVAGPSGLTINDVHVRQLQFHTATDKFGILTERSNDELLWLSVEISRQLGLMNVREMELAPA